MLFSLRNHKRAASVSCGCLHKSQLTDTLSLGALVDTWYRLLNEPPGSHPQSFYIAKWSGITVRVTWQCYLCGKIFNAFLICVSRIRWVLSSRRDRLIFRVLMSAHTMTSWIRGVSTSVTAWKSRSEVFPICLQLYIPFLYIPTCLRPQKSPLFLLIVAHFQAALEEIELALNCADKEFQTETEFSICSGFDALKSHQITSIEHEGDTQIHKWLEINGRCYVRSICDDDIAKWQQAWKMKCLHQVFFFRISYGITKHTAEAQSSPVCLHG